MLPAMVEFSRQFGDLLVDFDPAQIQGLGNSTDRTIIEIPDNQIKTVFSKLITQVTNGAHISSAAKLRLMKNYLLKKRLNKPCISLFKDLMIAPDGKVYFCWGWNKVIGNILDDGFKQQWEQAIKNNLAAIDGNMERCKSCGFSHVRWPDLEFADIITTINAFRKKYFKGITK
jgi:MoaA/NifB/PqqE/SkfB family radical SAM enzyme